MLKMQPFVELTLLLPLASCMTFGKELNLSEGISPSFPPEAAVVTASAAPSAPPNRSLLPQFLPLKFLFIPDPV